jgi:putative NADH-flavin reductase
MNQNMKIAVIGGSGKAGKYLLKQLADQGFKIRALTRDLRKLEESAPVERVTGDVTDYAFVYNLLEGSNVVISTPGQTKGAEVFFISINWGMYK